MKKKCLLTLLLLLVCVPLYAAEFQPVWEKTILPHEGGYSNSLHDSGNWTGCREGKGRMLGSKYGISACTYGESLLKQGIIIKHLTSKQAGALAKVKFWDSLNLGDLKSQGIAAELCDEAYNAGTGNPKQLLEKVFAEIEWATKEKIPVPSKFTPETIKWINDYTLPRERRISFYNSIRIKRVRFYVDLVHKKPMMRQFFLSWINRSVD